jgi:hypothetical protein
LIALRKGITLTGTVNIERWKIESQGAWTAGGNSNLAKTMLVAYLEQAVTPETNFAFFSTGNVCNSISMSGNPVLDSFNSSVGAYASSKSSTGCDVGSNGNIGGSGKPTIDGNVTVPGGSGGSCTGPTPGGVSSSITVTGTVYNETKPVTYDSPPVPSPWTQTGAYTGPMTLSPGNYGNISITGGTLTLAGGAGGNAAVYNINSITAAGKSNISINPPGPVIINIIGQPSLSTAMDLAGGSLVNPTTTPANALIEYAGTGAISMAGNSQGYFMLYAPNAAVNLVGTSDIYGTVVGRTITESGTPGMHYDRALRNLFVRVGNFQIVSWNRVVN